MKEVWVKKTIWRRHLINEDDEGLVRISLSNNDKISYETFCDYDDMNMITEYDNEEVILPIEFEIKGV